MHKNRFLNKYTVLSFALVFAISFLSWGIQSEYFANVLTFTPDIHYATIDDYFGSTASGLRFEDYIDYGFTFLQILLPVIVSVSAMNFAEERRGIFPYAYTRVNGYRKFVLSSIFEHAAISSIAITLAFVVYILFGLLLVGKYLMVSREYWGNELFADILGESFNRNHPVVIYTLESILKYVIFPFIYSLFTMAFTFYTDKKYMIISLPTAYYLILTILCNSLPAIPEPHFFDFTVISPSFPISAQSYMEPSTATIGLGYIPVVAFVVVTLIRSFKDKSGDKIGV